MTRRALVTGSEGFIGRHMAAALQAAGYRVAYSDVRDPDVYTDIRDLRLLPQSGGTHFDLVVHCAALVDGRETIENKAALIAAYNLQLDGALFEWALQAKPGRIVYFSSSAAYPAYYQCGPYAGLKLEEWMVRDPSIADATYGMVKAVGERLAAETRLAGVPVTVVRPFSGYGDDQDDCYPFPAMIRRALRGERPFRVWGDGSQVRDFIHVDDVVGAVLALAEQGVDGPVNLGTGRATSMDDLARLCMTAAGYSAPILHLADKPAGVEYRVADTRLLLPHYEPQVSLEEGVQRAFDAAVQRRAAA